MKTEELLKSGISSTALRFLSNPIRIFIFWAARPFFAGILEISNTRFAQLQRELNEAGDRFTRLQRDLNEADDRLDILQTKFTDLHEYLNSRFTVDESRLSKISELTSSFNLRISEIGQDILRVSEIESEVIRISDKLNSTTESAESIRTLAYAGKKDQEAVAFRLTTIERFIAETAERLGEIRRLLPEN